MRILVDPAGKPGLNVNPVATQSLCFCYQNLDCRPLTDSQGARKQSYTSILAKNVRYSFVSNYLA